MLALEKNLIEVKYLKFFFRKICNSKMTPDAL